MCGLSRWAGFPYPAQNINGLPFSDDTARTLIGVGVGLVVTQHGGGRDRHRTSGVGALAFRSRKTRREVGTERATVRSPTYEVPRACHVDRG